MELIIILIVFIMPGLLCWRAMTGCVAWAIHTAAVDKRGITPELEDWVAAAFMTMFLIPFWPIILAFKYAPNWAKTDGEIEAEKLVAKIRYDRMVLDNERMAKQLEIGEKDVNA